MERLKKGNVTSLMDLLAPPPPKQIEDFKASLEQMGQELCKYFKLSKDVKISMEIFKNTTKSDLYTTLT